MVMSMLLTYTKPFTVETKSRRALVVRLPSNVKGGIPSNSQRKQRLFVWDVFPGFSEKTLETDMSHHIQADMSRMLNVV